MKLKTGNSARRSFQKSSQSKQMAEGGRVFVFKQDSDGRSSRMSQMSISANNNIMVPSAKKSIHFREELFEESNRGLIENNIKNDTQDYNQGENCNLQMDNEALPEILESVNDQDGDEGDSFFDEFEEKKELTEFVQSIKIMEAAKSIRPPSSQESSHSLYLSDNSISMQHKNNDKKCVVEEVKIKQSRRKSTSLRDMRMGEKILQIAIPLGANKIDIEEQQSKEELSPVEHLSNRQNFKKKLASTPLFLASNRKIPAENGGDDLLEIREEDLKKQ